MNRIFATWSWLDDGVLPGLISIVRSCWIWPWLALIQGALAPSEPGAAMPLWLVLVLPVASFTFARWAAGGSADGGSHARTHHRGTGSNAEPDAEPDARIGQRLLVGLFGLIAIVLVLWWQLYRGDFSLFDSVWIANAGDSLIHWPETAIPGAVLLIAAGLFLWLRGILDASSPMTHDSVWSTFVMGIVMMVLYLIVISISELDLVQRLLSSVLVMLAAGMAALAFSSIKITAGLDRALGFGVRKMSGEDGGTFSQRVPNAEAMPVINRYWFISVGGAIGLLMLLGILLTLLIAPEVLSAIFDVLWTALLFVGDIVSNVLILFAYVGAIIFFYLFEFIEPLLRRLMERIDLDPELLEGLRQEPEATPEALEAVERAPVPDEYRWLGLLVVAIVMVVVFALIIRRLAKTDVETLDEERESILSGDLLQDQLANLWSQLRNRFTQQDPDDPFLPLEGEDTRQRIRSVYQSLLRTANELGQPRQPSLTPIEYEQRLAKTTAAANDNVAETLKAAKSVDGTHSNAPPDNDGRAASTEEQTIRYFYGEKFEEQLDVITAGYVAARYSANMPSEQLASAVESAWAEIQQSMAPAST